jgi:hypothetical protein
VRELRLLFSILHQIARVAELVDARDLKSLGGNSVPVRFRPRAPSPTISRSRLTNEVFSK